MCGIAGYLGPASDKLRGIGQALACRLCHRGPDDEGQQMNQLESKKGTCLLLVHRRLSILDLSSQGHQPMYDPETGNWIVYNGEIYNFEELRRSMAERGAVFCSQTDTEVILKGYAFAQRDILKDLCGMYAFCVFDRRAEELFLAVDPLGIKPLYYSSTADGVFLFASEIRSLLETGLIPRRVDPVALEGYLSYGAVQAPNTMLAGISALLPGTYIRVNADGVVSGPHQYWRMPYARAGERRPREELRSVEELRDVLERVLKQHLRSDVPLGVLLSGGIDSSSVLALASQHITGLNSFAVTFREEQYSEGTYSALMAKQCGSSHHEISVSEQGVLEMLPRTLAALDQPSVDGVNVFAISHAVRNAGVSVVLSGQGGDEIFAGYSTFQRVAAAQRWRLRFPFPRAAYRAAGKIVSQTGASGYSGKLGQYLSNGDPFSTYFLLRQLYSPAMRRRLFPSGGAGTSPEGLPQSLSDSLRGEGAGLEPVNLVSLLETRTYLANTLLRDGDVMSMAHGVEVRVPFLDRRVCELVAGIPGQMKLRNGLPKPLLLGAMNGLIPREIYARPKQGFTFPWAPWLHGHLRSFAEEALTDRSCYSSLGIEADAVSSLWTSFLQNRQAVSWSRIWGLVVLREWAVRNGATL